MLKGPISLVSSSCIKWQLLSIIILVMAFSGCVSTQTRTHNDQIETRLTELEKNQQAKDSQIVDLQYQVKDLSSKIDASKPDEAQQVSPVSQGSAEQVESGKASDMIGISQIIRVKASPEKIQTALKAAGVYTGPVDGKIGQGTRAAIIEFQKSHGLKADGVLGKKTWDELKVFLK